LFSCGRDFAIVGFCFVVWCFFAPRNFASTSDLLAGVCERVGADRYALRFAILARDYRIVPSGVCLTCEWERGRAYNERVERLRRKVEQFEADGPP
jgi:hypothetical protein